MKRPSVVGPTTWLFTTVFAAGMFSAPWHNGSGPAAWALVGFAGVLMQNATFMCVGALRFGLAQAATHNRNSVVGLRGFSTVLFGFNQLFLATALLGFTVAGAIAGLIPGWHAWRGYISAVLLFLSSSASPYNANDTNRIALVGLIGCGCEGSPGSSSPASSCCASKPGRLWKRSSAMSKNISACQNFTYP